MIDRALPKKTGSVTRAEYRGSLALKLSGVRPKALLRVATQADDLPLDF
jgi:hypothetical protein